MTTIQHTTFSQYTRRKDHLPTHIDPRDETNVACNMIPTRYPHVSLNFRIVYVDESHQGLSISGSIHEY